MFDALLLGEALVDRLPSGPVAAGAPLNVARHLRGLGLAPLLLSCIGAGDAEAQRIEHALRQAGLGLDGLQRDPDRPTGTVQVQLDAQGGHRFEIQDEVAWDGLRFDAAAPLWLAHPAPLAYFGTLAQRREPSRSSIRRLLGLHAGLRFLDLNLREGVPMLRDIAEASLALAHWAKVNEDELAQLGRWWGWADDDAAALVRRFGLQRLIVTCGAAGYRAFGPDGACIAQGAGLRIPRLVDTVGAGDAFTAFVLAARLRGRDLAASLVVANAFAAALCGEAGAAPARPDAFYPVWQAELLALPKET